jgi:predicted nucleotidyltransferase
MLEAVPGLPEGASRRLLATLADEPAVEEVWLYGSRAMRRERPGSDIDLTLKGARLGHGELVRLMAAIDDLLLPWTVDLSLEADLDPAVREHIQRVGVPLRLR